MQSNAKIQEDSLRLSGCRVNFCNRPKQQTDLKSRRPRSAVPHHNLNNIDSKGRPFSADFPESKQNFCDEILKSDNYFKKLRHEITQKLSESMSRNENELIESNEDEINQYHDALSEIGSEDTYVSLGTKIKSIAQTYGNKGSGAVKNYLKYRNITKSHGNETRSESKINNTYHIDNRYSVYNKYKKYLQNQDSNQVKQSIGDMLNTKTKQPNELSFKSHSFDSNPQDISGRVSFGDCFKNSAILPTDFEPLSSAEEHEASPSSNHMLDSKFNYLDSATNVENRNECFNAKIYEITSKYTSESNSVSRFDENINQNHRDNKIQIIDPVKANGGFFYESSNSKNCDDQKIPELYIEASPLIKNDRNCRFDNEYPSYLENSERKLYSSKIIEDYKKEIENIDNLHQLTLKDIKVDRISPTPLNIDSMFDQTEEKKNKDRTEASLEKSQKKNNVSDIPTKELIQNYMKVKEMPYKSALARKSQIPRKAGKPKDVQNDLVESNLKLSSNFKKNPDAISLHSSRLGSVRNDKDIESWISLDNCELNTQQEDQKSESNDQPPCTEEHNEPMPKSPSLDSNKTIHLEEVIDFSCGNELAEKKIMSDETDQMKVLNIHTMLAELESLGDVPLLMEDTATTSPLIKEDCTKDNFEEIFKFLDQVEQSANDALTVVSSSIPTTVPKFEQLVRLPQPELAQRLVTAVLQLEERSCCINLLQESLATHKEQMIAKLNAMEKQTAKNMVKVRSEAEETIKRHQNFIDQLINDKKTLNHRVEQLVDERKAIEKKLKRDMQTLEDRYRLQMKNQHDRLVAAQQIAKQRWVKEKAEKIKDLTVKGLEGELREMAERQQKEIADLKLRHTEQLATMESKYNSDVELLRQKLELEKDEALSRERQMAAIRMEKQMLELESTYQEQRTNLMKEMRLENEKALAAISAEEKQSLQEVVNWRKEQEKLIEDQRKELDEYYKNQAQQLQESLKVQREELVQDFEKYKQDFEMEQQCLLRKKTSEIASQSKRERDKEIENAIEAMEAEAQAGRRELTDALRRTKEQYELELREIAETEKATLRRYQDAQARIRETENKCADLEVLLAQADAKNRALTEKMEKLDKKLEGVESEASIKTRTQVECMQKEMEDLKTTHEQQMQQLYAKVKVAVARKDSALQAMQRENAKLQEKVVHLEQRLQQQRKDFLKAK